MTEYSDFKVEPLLADLVVAVATEQYGRQFRAKSRAGHEALLEWLALRADPDTVRRVFADPPDEVADALDNEDIDDLEGLTDYLRSGRFEGDPAFDPFPGDHAPAEDPDED